jgi:hypothetical protein
LSNIAKDEAESANIGRFAQAIGRYILTGEGRDDLTEIIRAVVPSANL